MQLLTIWKSPAFGAYHHIIPEVSMDQAGVPAFAGETIRAKIRPSAFFPRKLMLTHHASFSRSSVTDPPRRNLTSSASRQRKAAPGQKP